MSSIYRKGRDGYFYYQKYTYNPISKKNDKKIFHSLGTKNKNEALKLKVSLDEKYDNENKTLKKKYTLKKYFIRISLILISLFITKTVFFNFINQQRIVQKKNNSKLKDQSTISYNHEEMLFDSLEKNIDVIGNKQNTLQKSDTLIRKKDPQPKALIDYEIVRREVLSNTFKQIKFSVNIDRKLGDDMILQLCEELVKENNDFINFIICFYTNDKIGKAVAKGNLKGMNKKEISDSWLAMYTYNKVEGAYYDNNPGSYMRNDL